MKQEKRKNTVFSEELLRIFSTCWPTPVAAVTALYFHDKDVVIILNVDQIL